MTQTQSESIPRIPSNHEVSRKVITRYYTPWTLEQTQEALFYIPSEDTNTWLKVLTALKTEFGEAAYNLADEWSQTTTADNYSSKAFKSTWRSLKSGKFSVGWLRTVAERHGYKQTREYIRESQETIAARTALVYKHKQEEAIQKKTRAEEVKKEIAERLKKSKLANPHNPYLQKKQVLPNGIRQEGNNLLIPLYRDGELVNLQFISPKGDKWYVSGGQVKNAYCIIGDSSKLNNSFYICEGWATGVTIYEQTGKNVICAMNESNLLGVAKAMRLKHPNAKIFIAADNDLHKVKNGLPNGGVESACIAAQAVGGDIVVPPFEKDGIGGDWNDYHLLNLSTGKDQQTKIELERVASSVNYTDNYTELNSNHEKQPVAATHSDMPSLPPHPLSQFITLGSTPQPPRWIIKNFIAEGVAIIAGGHGSGKTTALFPLAMAAAGIHRPDYPLAPHEWRHVVYITEDVNQVQRIATGYLPSINKSMDDLNERVHVVDAKRMDAAQMVAVGGFYRENFTRTLESKLGKPIELLPLVVVDTLAATFEIENENDNAEASRTIAHIKQDFADLPVWIISHVSKSNLTRDRLRSANPTSRGASAFEADANQVLYITHETDGSRWLARGKTRFESPYKELKIVTNYKKIASLNEYGNTEELTLRWGMPEPQEKTRTEVVEEAKKMQLEEHHDFLKRTLLDAVTAAWTKGMPLNKTAAKAKISCANDLKTRLLDELLISGWLYEVFVPKDIRIHNKTSFLVALTESERIEFKVTGKAPEYKLAIPPSWHK